MERYLSDMRTSLRILKRSPGLAVSAVVALAMGIGFTTTMFSIVHGGTRDLPFTEPDELVALRKTYPQRGWDLDATPFDYLEWSRQQKQFEALGAFRSNSMNLAGDARHPDRRSGALLTPNTFELLGVRPHLGRVFLPEDAAPGAPAVALLGYDLWRSRFDTDSSIVNRVIRVDGQPRTVIGVMPQRFGFPVHSELWLPLEIDPGSQPSTQGSLTVFGRLRDGLPRDAAQAELVTIASRLARQYPETHEGRSARVHPFVDTEMAPNTAAILYLMLGIVSFALLIACANVANLLLARAAGRTREVAIRSALGASRARIVAQHVSESLVLAVLGGLLGLGIAHIAVRFFAVSTANIIDAFWIDFRVDGTVVLFATALLAGSGVLAGILPGLRATSTNVAEMLNDTSGGTTGLRIGRLARSLVVVEVALASGLLIMTMTFTKSAVALRAVELPFPSRQVFTGQLGLLQETLGSTDSRARLALDLSARLEAIPGATAVALASVLPGRGAGNPVFTLDAPPSGETTALTTTGLALVTPGFLDVLGAQVLRGRNLEWRDGPDAPPVALVNQSWVRQYSEDRDPLGRRIWFGEQMLEIVGVVPDLQMQDPEDRATHGVYASLLQVRPYVVRLMIRTAGDPLRLAASIRSAVEAEDPDLPLFEVATLHDAIYADKKVLEAFGTLFLVFGAGALFLTMVGLYGVVSFAVRQRSREIGVRVALGATSRDVVRLVLGQGATLVLIGTAFGLLIAFALSHALASAIEFVEPAGLLTYLMIAGALSATALAGLLSPVRRALALQPLSALRLD